jgi:predicted TIM-barrel fold metal-dependent hydrolase
MNPRSQLSRRDFTRYSIVGGIATASGLSHASEAAAKGSIDAHVHVWTPDVKKYPLDSKFTIDSMQPKSFTPEELLALCRPAGVNRVVLIQMSFYGFDNSYMLDTITKYPGTFSGVGIVDHHSPKLEETMNELGVRGVRGYRIHAHGNDATDWTNDEGMGRLWQIAKRNGWAVCPLINPSDLPAIEKLCQKYPGTRVVIDHFARIGISGVIDEQQLNQLCGLARFPGVHVKTSAFYALGRKKAPYDDLLPMIHRLVDAYSPSRLMWATDCPYQVQQGHQYVDSISLIRDRADFLSPSEKTQILRGTAERVFFS